MIVEAIRYNADILRHLPAPSGTFRYYFLHAFVVIRTRVMTIW
jgi:hypothetical protein